MAARVQNFAASLISVGIVVGTHEGECAVRAGSDDDEAGPDLGLILAFLKYVKGNVSIPTIGYCRSESSRMDEVNPSRTALMEGGVIDLFSAEQACSLPLTHIYPPSYYLYLPPSLPPSRAAFCPRAEREEKSPLLLPFPFPLDRISTRCSMACH